MAPNSHQAGSPPVASSGVTNQVSAYRRTTPELGVLPCRPPAAGCAGPHRENCPEVYTFPGITFSWGRHLANEWRRPGCVGARPVAGRRRPEEEGGEGSELAEPHMAWWRPSQGPSPFFLLPAMKLLPAHPRRRRHPEGRSAAEEARSALPSPPRMGTMLSSCRKQENHVSFFPGPSGVRGTEGPYLTNLSADPPGATNQRYVFRTPTPDCASTDLGRDGTHGRRAAPSSSQYRPSRTSRRLTSPRGTSLGRTTAP